MGAYTLLRAHLQQNEREISGKRSTQNEDRHFVSDTRFPLSCGVQDHCGKANKSTRTTLCVHLLTCFIWTTMHIAHSTRCFQNCVCLNRFVSQVRTAVQVVSLSQGIACPFSEGDNDEISLPVCPSVCLSLRSSVRTCLSVCLSIYLSNYIYLSMYLFGHLLIHLLIHLPIYLLTDLLTYPSTYLPTYPSIHPSTCLSMYPSTYLPTYLSIHSSIYLSLFI
jgi:hypothetical protein